MRRAAPEPLDLQRLVEQRRAGTRAAAGRAAGSSPAARPWPRGCPRSRPAASGRSRSSAGARSSSSSARIIARTTGQPVLAHEHVLGAAEADALGAELARRAASSGVSAFARTPRRRISSAQPTTASKSSLICGGTSGTAPRNTSPVPPSIVITSPSANSRLAERDACAPARSMLSASQPGHARLAHAARDDRRVARHAAVRRQHALRPITPWMSSGVVSQRTRIDVLAGRAALARPCRRRARRRRRRRPARR